jgi:hypothetical protein
MKHKKDDQGKLRWHLFPFEILIEVVQIFDQGAQRYGVDNWQKCKDWDRYFDAMMRHIMSWRLGEKIDPKSKKHHLAHAICCAIFLIWSDRKKDGLQIHKKR